MQIYILRISHTIIFITEFILSSFNQIYIWRISHTIIFITELILSSFNRILRKLKKKIKSRFGFYGHFHLRDPGFYSRPEIPLQSPPWLGLRRLLCENQFIDCKKNFVSLLLIILIYDGKNWYCTSNVKNLAFQI